MKRSTVGFVISVVLLVFVACGCRDDRGVEAAVDIAVTNSYLECAVEDLCGDDVRVMCLASPGMCPGHFDISPAQVRQLRDCRMLLLFDFQQKVEANLGRLKDDGLKIALVTGPVGLCVPTSYLTVCREVSEKLLSVYPEREAHMGERLRAIEERLNGLSNELRASVEQSQVASVPILASNHQAEFARWLGLEPVATFVGSDIETVSNIDHCLQQAAGQDIRFVIANQQEGTSLAQALAERLNAEAVVFSNFPQGVAGDGGFDGLLRDNVGALVEAATR